MDDNNNDEKGLHNLQDSIHLKKNMKNLPLSSSSSSSTSSTTTTSSSSSLSSSTKSKDIENTSNNTNINPATATTDTTKTSKASTLLSQHPLVGTLLWFMGVNKDKGIQVNQSNNNNDLDKPSTLSWKDHRGGQIAEYLSTQPVDGIGGSAASSKVADPQLLQRNARVITESEIQKNAASPMDDSSSPQWGFYVTITPENPQVFPKAK